MSNVMLEQCQMQCQMQWLMQYQMLGCEAIGQQHHCIACNRNIALCSEQSIMDTQSKQLSLCHIGENLQHRIRLHGTICEVCAQFACQSGGLITLTSSKDIESYHQDSPASRYRHWRKREAGHLEYGRQESRPGRRHLAAFVLRVKEGQSTAWLVREAALERKILANLA